MTRLNLCCGLKPLDGFVNVDILDMPAKFPARFAGKEFIQYDLNVRPWPFGDESCDYIVARDGIEHLRVGTFIEVMNEIWRILEPNGQFVCQVPNAEKPSAFTDPTHQMWFTIHSMDYFDPRSIIGTLMTHYTDRKWHIIKAETADEDTALHFIMQKISHATT